MTTIFSSSKHAQHLEPQDFYRNDAPFWSIISIIALVAVIIRLLFWKYTGRVWEDALITILHAENAAQGLGLSHAKVDEGLVHGFTSPLSVLIPLLGEWIKLGFGLDFIRIVSAASSAVTVFFAAMIMRTPGMQVRAPLIYLVCGYLAIEHHQILWGMSGMETQIVTMVILMSIHAFVTHRTVYLGITLGLCMLARPDFAFWAALVGVAETYRAWHLRDARRLLLIIAVALALYLPWISFTAAYYGSPVPNTIHAKSSGYNMWWHASSGINEMLSEAAVRLHRTIFPLLGPSFGGNGTGFIPLMHGNLISLAMMLMIVVSAVGLAWRSQWRTLSIVGFVAVYSFYYIFFVPNVFGWYVVPFTAVAVLLASKGLDICLARLPDRSGYIVASIVAIAYIGVFASVLPQTARGEKSIQRFVENPVRIKIGRWLHDNTPADATVAGEPLGFMGYYSRRTYYDYPGLASRNVVSFLQTSGMEGLSYMLQEMRPDYLVLRDMEINALRNGPHMRWFSDLYSEVQTYEVTPEHRARLLFPGANIDLRFTVFQRKHAVPREPVVDTLSPLSTPVTHGRLAFEGLFRKDAKYFDSPAASTVFYGSWVGSDSDTGSLSLPFSCESRYIAVPFITGPVTYDLDLQVVDLSTGTEVRALRTLHSIKAIPVTVRSWRYWLVELPPDSKDRRFELRARDASTAWGGWMAVGVPHIIPKAIFDAAHLKASKRPATAPIDRPTMRKEYE